MNGACRLRFRATLHAQCADSSGVFAASCVNVVSVTVESNRCSPGRNVSPQINNGFGRAPVQSRLMVDRSMSLILDTLCCVLGACAGVHGPFDSYLTRGPAGCGFNEVVADPEPQQLTIDVDIAALSGVVATDAACCHDTHTTPFVVTRRLTQSSPPRSGLGQTAVMEPAATVVPAANRWAGVAIFSDDAAGWCCSPRPTHREPAEPSSDW